MLHRPDRLTSVSLAALDDLRTPELARAFAGPEGALAVLTADLHALWDHHRIDDVAQRRIGSLQLASGAYVQWIGYGRELAVECSSNAFLDDGARLSEAEQQTLQRAGFMPPDEDVPNFWLAVEERAACARAAFSIVAVLTAVFGVYAG